MHTLSYLVAQKLANNWVLVTTHPLSSQQVDTLIKILVDNKLLTKEVLALVSEHNLISDLDLRESSLTNEGLSRVSGMYSTTYRQQLIS